MVDILPSDAPRRMSRFHPNQAFRGALSQKGRIPRHPKRLSRDCFRESRQKATSPKNGRILRDVRVALAGTGVGSGKIKNWDGALFVRKSDAFDTFNLQLRIFSIRREYP